MRGYAQGAQGDYIEIGGREALRWLPGRIVVTAIDRGRQHQESLKLVAACLE